MTEQTSLYCANHPNIETMLRCNRCEKLICTKCAQQTPTGYRCKECVRGQQKVFETAQFQDLPIGFVVAAVISFLGSLIASRMGFFVIFIAPIVGTIIAEATRFITKRRRSQRLFQIVAAGAILGGLPIMLRELFFFSVFGLIWQGVYLVTVTSTAYYRLKGIFFNR
jgi:hypothetical protein